MMWTGDIKAELFSYSRFHISILMTHEVEDRQCHLTGFYGGCGEEEGQLGFVETVKTCE